jgi:hypothetical protein
MKLFLVAALAFAFTSQAFGQTRDPMGEEAFYDLDKARSHSMIKSGTFDGLITAYKPDAEDGPVYELSLNYKFVIQWVGLKEGTQKIDIPADYFSPDFIRNLRARGSFESEKFKVKHEGFGNTTTMNGTTYENCDKILIYDVNTETAPDFVQLLLGYDNLSTEGEIENLEIRAHVYEGIPVLGAVKIDVEGDTSGMHVFAGADLR